MRIVLGSIGLVLALSMAGSAQAHIQLTSPTARYRQDNSGLKTAPCGSGTATGAVTHLVPGQVLTVTWKESISHAGHYRIALASSEGEFSEPTSLKIPTTPSDWILADGIADKTGTSTYSYEVELPDRECPACVLQLLQVMSTGTDGTNTGPFSGVYHACADLQIATDDGDASAAPDSARSMDVRPDLAWGRDAAASTGGADGNGRGVNDASMAAGGRSGAGGTAGSGGVAGSGGIQASGGDPPEGDDGSASGGDDGSGGASEAEGGAGGSSSRSEAAAGGVSGRSGTMAASGGANGGLGAGQGDIETEGCSCHVGTPAKTVPWALIAALAGLLALGSGRRRR